MFALARLVVRSQEPEVLILESEMIYVYDTTATTLLGFATVPRNKGKNLSNTIDLIRHVRCRIWRRSRAA